MGANIVQALNHRSTDDVLIVDNPEAVERFKDVAGCTIGDCLGKGTFQNRWEQNNSPMS